MRSLAKGRLIRVLPDWQPAPTPASLVFPSQRATRAAVCALIDELVQKLRHDMRNV